MHVYGYACMGIYTHARARSGTQKRPSPSHMYIYAGVKYKLIEKIKPRTLQYLSTGNLDYSNCLKLVCLTTEYLTTQCLLNKQKLNQI